MPDTHARIARIARQAAELIETNGWWQGEYFPTDQGHLPDEQRTVCATGALNCAATGHVQTPNFEVLEAFAQHLNQDIGLLIQWNDAHDRTASEVVAALRSFADAQDGGEQP